MVITIGFYTTSHGKFHDRGYSDILYGINSIDIMGCCTPVHSVTSTTITWLWSCSTTYIGPIPFTKMFEGYTELLPNRK